MRVWLEKNKNLLQFVWKNVIIVVFYVVAMWVFLVAAVYLFTKDLLGSAGIVSAVILFKIIQAEFNKEFFGSRNPKVVNNAVQKQSKR